MDKENQHITLGGRKIPLIITRHRRARRISLRLMPARNGVVMTLPMRANLARALEFAQQKTEWILAHVEPDTATLLIEGARIPVLGKEYIIRRMDGRGVTSLSDGTLLVYGAPEFTARRVKDFLKKHLQHYSDKCAGAIAKQIGKSVHHIRIADMRSRWGSCSTSGGLAFNWRLVFAPPGIVTYLIAHEVAHLAEMNHGRPFWRVVETLYPDYKEARIWLKREGHTLYRYH